MKDIVMSSIYLLVLQLVGGSYHTAYASSLDPKDIVQRQYKSGCELIPYDGRRKTCIDNNQGLHTPQACNAQACSSSATQQQNRMRNNAWSECATRRVRINTAFSATLTDIGKFQKGPIYSTWSPPQKGALRAIVNTITRGQPTHDAKLREAKAQARICKGLIESG